jgi:hypothetical protein
MPTLDLTIVAARRPDLLSRTLRSFQDRLFRHFQIATAILNIDPVWGDDADAQRCADATKQYFPTAMVFTPETPGFCAAVKRVWSATKADFIFHLEDDWEITEDIDQSILDYFKDSSLAQVSLVAKEKNWDRARRGDFHYVKRRGPLFGPIKSPFRKKVPAFTTAPAFTRGEFARRWADLMNPALDPEKQAYMGINPPLEEFVRPFRNYLYPGKLNEITIVDIGREWRDARNIEKKIINGQSIWTNSPRA